MGDQDRGEVQSRARETLATHRNISPARVSRQPRLLQKIQMLGVLENAMFINTDLELLVLFLRPRNALTFPKDEAHGMLSYVSPTWSMTWLSSGNLH